MAIGRQATEMGEITARVDAAQMAFEIDAMIDDANYMYMRLRDPRQLDRGRTAIDRILRFGRTLTP